MGELSGAVNRRNVSLSDPLVDLDSDRLEQWFEANIPGFKGPTVLRRIAGGQSNPTYRVDGRTGTYALRRKPFGELLGSAHAIDREYRVMKALHEAEFPVPWMHAYCADESVIGAHFYVMSFVEGRVFWDQSLPDESNAERSAIYDSLGATIGRLHTVDYNAIGLSDFGRPGGFLGRQISRWTKQYLASENAPIDAMRRLIEWLPRHTPAQQRTGIAHGDYRLDNVMVHPTEPRIVAVLDWELCTIGDPIADFAYHVMAWRISPTVFRGLHGVNVAALGIPREDEYVAAYCRRTGLSSIEDWEFYMVYSMFRIAAILQGVAKRAMDGNASSGDAESVGRAAPVIAAQAWRLAQQVSA
jgi:aminoglycoside phosphotransferase (APT) family kinase protein